MSTTGHNAPTRFSAAEYLKMDRAGLFEGRRVELVRGKVLRMHAQATAHRWAISRGARALQAIFPPERFWVVVQGTLRLKDGLPEPDFHLLEAPEGTPDAQLPTPFLGIEISDTTYRRDAGVKLRQYASAGVGEYWIVDLNGRRIEVHQEPARSGPGAGRWGYGKTEYLAGNDPISPAAFGSYALRVGDLLP